MSDNLQIIRQQPYQHLKRALDRVVINQPELANGCALLLRPLDLLQELGASAYAALDNNIQAIERMRLTIQIAAADTFEIRDALNGSLEGHHHSKPAIQPPCEQGLLNLGALVVVALAAGRVGHRFERSSDYVDVVEAAAVASLPAQAFSRALIAGLDYQGLAALLSGLNHKEPRYTRLRALAPTLLDPCDGTSFKCIQRLLEHVRKEVPFVREGRKKIPREWDGAVSDVVASLQLEDQDKLLVRLKDEVADNPDNPNGLQQFDRVVFVSSSHDSSAGIEQDIPDDRADLSSFTITIPFHARAGMIGLQSEEMRKRLVQDRNQLVNGLEKENKEHACLKASSIPVERLRITSTLPPAPRFSPAAVWGVRILDIALKHKGDATTQICVTLSKPAIARRVQLYIPNAQQPVFERELAFDADRLTASGDIPAEYASQPEGVVRVYVRDDENPDDEKTFSNETTGHETNSETSDTNPPPDTQPGTPPGTNNPDSGSSGNDTSGNDVNVPASLGVVLLHPAFIPLEDHYAIQPAPLPNELTIHRISRQQAVQAFNEAKAALAQQFDLQEITLPWLADSEQTVSGKAPTTDGLASAALIDHLENLAALTVGGENHVFVALAPPADAQSSFVKVMHSEAAKALVICTPDRLTDAINIAARTHDLNNEQSTTERLRILGNLQNGKVILTEPARVEVRAKGSGGNYVTEIVAVGFRANGSRVVSQRIRTVNATRSGGFMSLLPVDNDIVSVQLQHKPEIFAVELKAVPEKIEAIFTDISEQTVSCNMEGHVHRRITPSRGAPLPSLYQPEGNPYVEITKLAPQEIAWRYGHSRGIRPHIEIELRFGEIWRRVYSAPEGSTSADIDFTRLAPGLQIDGLRVVASDGWNTMVEEVDGATLQNSGFSLEGAPALIRPVGELQYWIDTDIDDTSMITWSVEDENGRQEISTVAADVVIKIDSEHVGKSLIAESPVINPPPIKIYKKLITYKKFGAVPA